MRPIKNACVILACASLLVPQFGCSWTKSLLTSTHFSESAYNTDKEIKTDALALLDQAKDKAPYASAAAGVDQLLKKIDGAISTEQGRTKNGSTVEQWKKVKAQLSSLFEMWKSKGTLLPGVVKNARTQVSDLFDELIKTENDKRPRS